MIRNFCVFAVGLLAVVFASSDLRAIGLLSPASPVVAIDTDPPGSMSSSPNGERVIFAIDGTLAKYLNFGEENSGFIVTPDFINGTVGGSIVQSFQLTTANDAEVRDPATYALYGTLDPIMSTNHSAGVGEAWTLIGSGPLACPAARNTLCPAVTVPNLEAYLSYKMLFPTVKNAGAANSMQIAEVEFFKSLDGTGSGVLTAGDTILAIDISPSSSSPGGEQVTNAIDTMPFTKYLNFGKVNSGLIVTGPGPKSLISSFTITTANDATERDPAAYALYGTNEAITSPQHSQGNNEDWTLISSGPITCPLDRSTPGTGTFFCDTVPVDQMVPYSSYRMVFTDVRNAATANSMQMAEVQFDGTVIPEPGTWVLALLALLGFGWWRCRAGSLHK